MFLAASVLLLATYSIVGSDWIAEHRFYWDALKIDSAPAAVVYLHAYGG